MITMMKNVTEAAMTKKRSKYSQSVKDVKDVKGVELGKGMVCEGVRVVERVRVGELVWSEICVEVGLVVKLVRVVVVA